MSKRRAFVEEVGVRDGVRKMIAVYEHEFPSKIYRRDIEVRVDDDEAQVLFAIALAWMHMSADAMDNGFKELLEPNK